MNWFWTVILCGLMASTAFAQEEKASENAEEHAAAKVASAYLMASAFQVWSEVVDLVDAASLDDVKRDQIQHVKNSPTMEVERELLQRLGYKDIGEMETSDSKRLFIAFNKAQHPDAPNREERLEQMEKTLEIKTLGNVEENENLIHVILRSSHQRGEVLVSAFDVISLVKTRGGTWKVSLNAQLPKFTPLEDPMVPIEVLEAQNGMDANASNGDGGAKKDAN